MQGQHPQMGQGRLERAADDEDHACARGEYECQSAVVETYAQLVPSWLCLDDVCKAGKGSPL